MKLRTFINASGETKPMIWDPGLMAERHALIASFLVDMKPEQLEKELAEMNPGERAGVLRYISSFS
jgi:hypothetical protein